MVHTPSPQKKGRSRRSSELFPGLCSVEKMVKGDREHGDGAVEEWRLPRGMSCPMSTAASETVYSLFNILKGHLLNIEEGQREY